MQGFKTIENKGVRIGTQQFVTMDLTLEVGALEEAGHGRGRPSPSRPRTPRCRSTIDSKTLETLPTAGRNPFFLATITPGVTHTGDPQFVRQQDQTNSSLLSLGGGPRRGNNYTLDGVAIVDIRNRATVIPSIEAVEEVKVQVTHLRRGDGTHRRRRVQHDGQVGLEQLARQPARADPAQRHTRPAPTSPRRPATTAAAPATSPTPTSTSTAAPSAAPSSRTRRSSGAPSRATRPTPSTTPACALPTSRELSGDFSQSGITVYDPLTTRPQRRRLASSARPSRATSSPPIASAPWRNAMQQYWPRGRPRQLRARRPVAAPSPASSIRCGATSSEPRPCTPTTTRPSRSPAPT